MFLNISIPGMAARQLFFISVLLVLTQVVRRAVAAQQCTGVGSDKSILGWMLQGHIYKTMLAELPHTCVLSCRKDDRCQSFNWVISISMCEFSNRTKEARPDDFIQNPDRFYFRRDKNRGKLMKHDQNITNAVIVRRAVCVIDNCLFTCLTM